MSRTARYLAIGFIALCGVFTTGLTALNFYPGLAILPVASRLTVSPYCTVWQGAMDGSLKVEQAELARKIQAGSKVLRKEGGYKLWSTPDGEYWVPDTSDEVLSILLAQQQRHIYGRPGQGGVKAGDIVIDGGAHIGTYARKALREGAAKVIAVDPSPEALECLRRNLAKEIAAGQVVVVPKGIWDEEKTLTFFANNNGAAGDSFLTEGAGARRIAEIPVTTIDLIVKELKLDRVDLIKADIKGAGTRMITGGVETIRRFHPRIVISTEEAPEDPKQIHDALLRVAPNYRFRSGPCLFTGSEIRNDTIFFE